MPILPQGVSNVTRFAKNGDFSLITLKLSLLDKIYLLLIAFKESSGVNFKVINLNIYIKMPIFKVM